MGSWPSVTCLSVSPCPGGAKHRTQNKQVLNDNLASHNKHWLVISMGLALDLIIIRAHQWVSGMLHLENESHKCDFIQKTIQTLNHQLNQCMCIVVVFCKPANSIWCLCLSIIVATKTCAVWTSGHLSHLFRLKALQYCLGLFVVLLFGFEFHLIQMYKCEIHPRMNQPFSNPCIVSTAF